MREKSEQGADKLANRKSRMLVFALVVAVIGCGGESPDSDRPCQPYAIRVTSIASRNGCDGAGLTPEQYETQCNQFVNENISPAGCWSQYRDYLECVVSTDACNSCREPGGAYDRFRQCYCSSRSC